MTDRSQIDAHVTDRSRCRWPPWDLVAPDAAAHRLHRLACARPRPCPAPSPPPTPSPPPPLPTTASTAPPPAASTILPRRQQLWPSCGCRFRRHACRCGSLPWLPPLYAARGAVQIQCLLRAVALSCWWLELHCLVHRSRIGMHRCMAFAFVCRKLGPRGTSRKNKSGLLPEFQRTRRVPSLRRHWRDVCQCVRACCSAHVCHAHVRTAGLESGGDYLFKISAASGVVGRRSSCVSGGVGGGRWRGRHGARRQGHPSLNPVSARTLLAGANF